jgi:acyl transferase domain-containing protein
MNEGAKKSISADNAAVAIVGMACCYPGAANLEEFWRNIVHKIDATSDVPPSRWDPEVYYDPDPEKEDRLYCKKGGWLPDDFPFHPKRYGTMPRTVAAGEPDQFLLLRWKTRGI